MLLKASLTTRVQSLPEDILSGIVTISAPATWYLSPRWAEKYFPSSLWRPSLVTQSVKNPLAMQETRVWSLGQDDPLEKEMATHSSILACEISWTEEPGRLQSMVSQKS